MKKVKSFAIIAALLCSVFGNLSVAQADNSAAKDIDIADYENNEVLVMYTDGSCTVKTYSDTEALSEGLSELAEDDDVAAIQPNYSYTGTALTTNDTYVAEQWALDNDGSFYMEEENNDFPVFDDPFAEPDMPGQWHAPDNFGRPGGFMRGFSYSGTSAQSVTAVSGVDINVDEAWSVYNGGTRSVTVALVDTGIDYTHPELTDSIWTNTDEIADNGIDDDNNGYIDDVYGWNFYDGNNQVYSDDNDSHGTHCAGTIAAKSDNGEGMAGIVQSDNVKVMSVKALGGSDGSGTTESIIKAIKYAEENGAQICNLSLGTEYNDIALYMTMASSDMLFVVAAGNDGANTDESPSYPASYDLDNIISVANINYDGTLHYSSNYGKTSVDIAAPGSYILSTTPSNTYSYMTGTSMSAPMVSAAAAMVYSYYDGITLADVKEILLNSAAQLDSLTDITVSGGMLDLGAAMNYDTSTLSGAQWEKVDYQTDISNSQTYDNQPEYPSDVFFPGKEHFDFGTGHLGLILDDIFSVFFPGISFGI